MVQSFLLPPSLPKINLEVLGSESLVLCRVKLLSSTLFTSIDFRESDIKVSVVVRRSKICFVAAASPN